MFGKQVFIPPRRDNGTQRGVWSPGLAELTRPSPSPLQLPLVMVLLHQTLCLNSFRELRERWKFFLNLLGLDCLQLKLTHMPTWHISRRLVLNPFSFIGTQPCPVVDRLSMVAFALREQTWVAVRETEQPIGPKIFTIWPFTEKFGDP